MLPANAKANANANANANTNASTNANANAWSGLPGANPFNTSPESSSENSPANHNNIPSSPSLPGSPASTRTTGRPTTSPPNPTTSSPVVPPPPPSTPPSTPPPLTLPPTSNIFPPSSPSSTPSPVSPPISNAPLPPSPLPPFPTPFFPITSALSATLAAASTASSSTSSTPTAAGSQAVNTSWTDSFPCEFYSSQANGCAAPRSCYDCLNFNATVNGNSCMVSEYGRCINASTYNASMDYLLADPAITNSTSDQLFQFLATNATYCESDDSACAKCRETVFADVIAGNSTSALTTFCYGKNSCVCIAICEAPQWENSVGGVVCNSTAGNNSDSGPDIQPTAGEGNHGIDGWVLIVAISCGLALFISMLAVVLCMRQHYNRVLRTMQEDVYDADNSDSPDSRNNTAATENNGKPLLQLNLFAWNSLRSEIILREQLHGLGVKDISVRGVGNSGVQLHDTVASAPEKEVANISAPLVIVPLAAASAPSLEEEDVSFSENAPSAPDFAVL